MQAYKVKGRIDQSGRLILDNAIELQPGEVEVIVLQSVSEANESETTVDPEEPKRTVEYKTKALRDWFAKTQPAPPDFDPDQARWEALKEKYDL
jgi:hypothetical protein